MAATNQKVHISPGHSTPAVRNNPPSSFTWGAGGNTCVVADPYCYANSFVELQVTGTVPAAGIWAVTVSEGTFTITSSDSESSTLPVSYRLF